VRVSKGKRKCGEDLRNWSVGSRAERRDIDQELKF
jgi:hypothetical protein